MKAVKGQELANLCTGDLGEVELALRAGMLRVQRAPMTTHGILRIVT